MILEITQKGKSGSSRKLCLTMLAAASPRAVGSGRTSCEDYRPAVRGGGRRVSAGSVPPDLMTAIAFQLSKVRNLRCFCSTTLRSSAVHALDPSWCIQASTLRGGHVQSFLGLWERRQATNVKESVPSCATGPTQHPSKALIILR